MIETENRQKGSQAITVQEKKKKGKGRRMSLIDHSVVKAPGEGVSYEGRG